MRVRAKVTLIATAGALSLTGMSGTAHADKGLTVDPHSPAGVEYAVPLDSGRGHGGGSGGGGSRPLFGAGVTPPGHGTPGASAPSSRGAPGSGRGRSGGGGGTKIHRGSAPRASSAGGPDSTATPVRAAADYSSSGPVAGLIAGILLAGVCLGVFLRLRARRSARDGALQ